MLIRDNTARAKQIISIFWIMLGITVINMGSLAWQYFLVSAAQDDPSNVDMETLNLSDKLRQIIVIVDLVIYILAIVFFIMWFRRAYYNVHQLPWNNTRYTDGWAAGSWFVPIVWFWWPYQIMIDIWKGIQNALRERLGEPQSISLVGWWWFLFLANNLWGIAIVISASDTGVEGFLLSTQIRFIGEVINIGALLLVIQVVRRTSYFEAELLAYSQTPSDSIFSDNYIPGEEIELKPEN